MSQKYLYLLGLICVLPINASENSHPSFSPTEWHLCDQEGTYGSSTSTTPQTLKKVTITSPTKRDNGKWQGNILQDNKNVGTYTVLAEAVGVDKRDETPYPFYTIAFPNGNNGWATGVLAIRKNEAFVYPEPFEGANGSEYSAIEGFADKSTDTRLSAQSNSSGEGYVTIVESNNSMLMCTSATAILGVAYFLWNNREQVKKLSLLIPSFGKKNTVKKRPTRKKKS